MFQKARIRLTAWYLLIIMLVSVMFSSIIYRAATFELTRFEQRHRMRMEQRIQNLPTIPPLPPTPDLIDEVQARILWLLFTLNAGIFVVAGFLGYMLAGITLKPIKDMVEEQNRFISDASHELKTPLTSLKTAMEVHLREKNPSKNETKTLLTESIAEVDNLHSLSESLLQLAQYEQGQSSVEFETVQLNTIIEKAVQKIKPLAKQKNIIVSREIENSEIKGNESSLIDLLIILLDNAVKYSAEKSTVLVTSKKTDGNVIIQVADEGEGIAEKDAPHIFERFYRSDTARTKKDAGGYGLGLSIAKKIVETHKGSITAKNNSEKGSTFIVSLPRNN